MHTFGKYSQSFAHEVLKKYLIYKGLHLKWR